MIGHVAELPEPCELSYAEVESGRERRRMIMRILHGESSIATNWASRNLFPTNENNFAGYQFSSLSERRRDGTYRRTRGAQLPHASILTDGFSVEEG
jgi:hypothetical protein